MKNQTQSPIKNKILKNITLIISLIIFWCIISLDISFKNIKLASLLAVLTFIMIKILYKNSNNSSGLISYVNGFHFFNLCKYIIYLIKSVLTSSIDVIKIILSHENEPEGNFYTIKTKETNPVIKILYANSITLTPGTLTSRLNNDDKIEIHALTENFFQDLNSGEMEKNISSIKK